MDAMIQAKEREIAELLNIPSKEELEDEEFEDFSGCNTFILSSWVGIINGLPCQNNVDDTSAMGSFSANSKHIIQYHIHFPKNRKKILADNLKCSGCTTSGT